MPFKKISPKKRKFVEFLKTPNQTRPNAADTAKNIGISIPTYYRWLKDKKLLKLAKYENSQEFVDYFPEVLQTLVKKAVQGDIRSIKIYLDTYYNYESDKDDEEILTPDQIINIIRNEKKKNKEM